MQDSSLVPRPILSFSMLHISSMIFLCTGEEFEIIEPSVIDQLGNAWQTTPEEEKKKKQQRLEKEEAEKKQSPRTKVRQRWRNAIKQQIMLNKMDKNNELVKRKKY